MQYDLTIVLTDHYRIKERRMKEEHQDFQEIRSQSDHTDLFLVREGKE